MDGKIFAMLLATAGVAIANGPAVAQDSSASALSQEEVTVRPQVHEQVIRPAMGRNAMPTVLISVDRPVSYSDLDLSKPSDAAELEERVKEAASSACNQL